jgi:iron complex outermembrane receptor protein
MEYVNVGVKGMAKGNSTVRRGSFEIKILSAGTYTIFASFVGVETQE